MNMNNVIGPTHSLERFTFDRKHNMLIAEASDFNGERLAGQLWNDACDEGFVIRSHKTGERRLFTESHQEHDAEGELLCTVYKEVKGNLEVHILND